MNPPSSLSVHWVKNANGAYLDLLRANLNAPYFATPKLGVYVIWYTSPSKATVIQVGQGNIKDKLDLLRTNPQITQYSSRGQLKVSWVIIDPSNFDRVEVFLYDYYKPLVGERIQGVEPLRVTPLINE
jgi:hypothetical protein